MMILTRAPAGSRMTARAKACGMPSPRRGEDTLQAGRMRQGKIQHSQRAGRIGHQHGRVPRSAGTEGHRDLAAANPLRRSNYLAYGKSATSAQIEDKRF